MSFSEKTNSGATQLMLAAKQSDLRNCVVLIDDFGETVERKTRYGVSLLHFAALNHEHGLQISQHFFANCSFGMCKDVDGEEPIHFAIRAQNYNLAQSLLEMRNSSMKNLLHFFVVQQSIEFAELVLMHDQSLLRAVDAQGRNALMLAAEFADVKICEWLIRRGVNIKALSNGQNTMIHHSVLNQRFSARLICYFAAWKLDVDLCNEQGETPLELALRLEKPDAALELLNLGAILPHNTLLQCVSRNAIKSARFLVEKSHIHVLDSCGRNAMHLAAEKADLIMCQMLVSAGADVTALSGESRATALHFVGLNKAHGKALVDFFISLGLSLRERDGQGLTPLHYAMKVNNLDVAAMMNKRGASLKVQVDGLNLLYYTVMANSLKCAKFINSLDREQVREVNLNGLDAHHLSTQTGVDLELCQWLIKAINAAQS